MYVSFRATALSQTFFNEGLVENHLYSEICHIAPEGPDPALLPQWAVGKVKLSRNCSVDCASGNDVQWEFHQGCNGTSPFSICFRQGTVRPASGGPPEHCMSSQGAIPTFFCNKWPQRCSCSQAVYASQSAMAKPAPWTENQSPQAVLSFHVTQLLCAAAVNGYH